MAFYNPQRVVFNPDRMVIQAAGSVGGVLYDTFKQNYDNKLKASQWQQEQDLRKQQMEFNQALQNNLLLQEERDFDYKQQRANVADKQWQMDFDQRARQNNMQNYLRQQEINASKANRALEYQKSLLELQKLADEIKAKKQEQEMLNSLLNGNNNPSANNANNKNFLGDKKFRADAQFLDLASKMGKTYDTTHGFIKGAITRGFGSTGSESTDLNEASDLFLTRMQSDLLRGGKNAKWSLENIQAKFPINKYTLEAENQKIAKDLAGEWLSYAPTAYKLELAEKIGNAKTILERQVAIDEYQKNMDFYNHYAPKVEAFYWDKPISEPRTKTYIYDDKGVLSENKETSKTKPFNFGDFIQKAELANQARKMSTSDANTIMIENQKAYMTNPDPAGNVLIQLENGDYIKSSMDELKRLGVIE